MRNTIEGAVLLTVGLVAIILTIADLREAVFWLSGPIPLFVIPSLFVIAGFVLGVIVATAGVGRLVRSVTSRAKR